LIVVSDPRRHPGHLEGPMRTALLILLLVVATRVEAVVPLDTVQWASDSARPTAAGIARRVQAYYLVDFTAEAGRNMYWNLRESVRDTKLSGNHNVIHFLLVTGGSIEQTPEGEATEYWCKGVSGNHGLVRAFGGDARAVIVLVDGTGRVTSITRLGDANQEKKGIEALYKTATPLVEDASQFPLGCKASLQWLRLGDVNHAIKDLKKAGADGPAFVKLVTERANVLVEMDTKILVDPSTMPSDRLIALQRLNGLLQDFPGVPSAAAAGVAIKKSKDDKQLAAEQTAYGMLMEYLNIMRKTAAKKTPEVQMQWIPGLTAKFGGTYAAEIATMIRRASRLDQSE
jgi:hypothetical protein